MLPILSYIPRYSMPIWAIVVTAVTTVVALVALACFALKKKGTQHQPPRPLCPERVVVGPPESIKATEPIKLHITPRSHVRFGRKEQYEKFKVEWNKLKINPAKAQFDDSRCEFYTTYSNDDLKSLAVNRQTGAVFSSFFGTRHSIFKNYSCHGTINVSIEKDNTLLDRMARFFSNGSFEDLILELPQNLDPDQMLSHFLEKFDGVLVGEGHWDPTPKRFLMERMDELARLGVTTLFFEHLYYDTLQVDLDAFHTSGEMSSILQSRLEELDEGNHNRSQFRFLTLIQKAQKAGIRVVAIDTEASYDTCDKSEWTVVKHGAPRMQGLNFQAKEIIEKEKGGKYVALVGSAHVSTCYGVPGLSEILQLPNIVFAGKESLRKDVRDFLPQVLYDDDREGPKGGHVHVMLPSTEPRPI